MQKLEIVMWAKARCCGGPNRREGRFTCAELERRTGYPHQINWIKDQAEFEKILAGCGIDPKGIDWGLSYFLHAPSKTLADPQKWEAFVDVVAPKAVPQ